MIHASHLLNHSLSHQQKIFFHITLRSVLVASIMFAPFSFVRSQKMQSYPTDFVYSSPRGIYVYCGAVSASTTHPVGDTVGYRIERKSAKENWKAIADVSSVTTLDQFKASVNEGRRNEWMKMLKKKNDDSLWTFIRENPTLRQLPFGADRIMLSALGMLYLDSIVTAGVSYEYRVSILLQSGRSVLPKKSSRIESGKKWDLQSMIVSQIVETDSSIKIDWIVSKARPFPLLYHIYRRMVGQEEFKLLSSKGLSSTRNDSLLCSMYDDKLKRNQEYQYYVVPEDLVENKGPESQIASAYTVNFKRLPLPMRQRAVRDSLGVQISWNTSGWDYVLSTRIYRSMNYDSGYVKIAEVPATDTTYHDQSARGMIRYYYRLTNVSYRNYESQMSMPFFGFWKSELPPATPQSVTAKPIKGGVEITWDKNQEQDVAGYYVCRAFDIDDSLLTISPLLQSNQYVDTSSVLSGSKEYRYAVVALNTSQIKSLFSTVAYARPLIATNPTPPRDIYAYAHENGIAINWNDPREYDESVFGYVLYRGTRKNDEIRYTILTKMQTNPERLSYFDSTAKPGTMYHYAVASIDLIGNEGIKSRDAEAMIRIELPPSPADVHATKSEDVVLIEWEDMQEENISSFVIYRNERGKEAKKIATVKYPTHDYKDKSIKKDMVYYYSISSIDKKGNEGKKSELVYVVP